MAQQTWKQFVEETDPNDPAGRSRRQILLAKYYETAESGEPSVLKDAIARELGKVPDVIQQDTSITVKIKRTPGGPTGPKGEPVAPWQP